MKLLYTDYLKKEKKTKHNLECHEMNGKSPLVHFPPIN